MDSENKFLNEQVEKKAEMARIYTETLHALDTEERFVNLLAGYHPDSVKQFKNFYAHRKAAFYEMADSRARYRRMMKTRWWTEALNELHELMMVKVFMLQCRWVAGQIDCEGMVCCEDFIDAVNVPQQHSIVEPITRAEFEVMMKGLQHIHDHPEEYAPESNHYTAYKHNSMRSGLQFYHRLRLSHKKCNDYISPLAQYYARHYGLEEYFTLPIPRACIEEYYNVVQSLAQFHPRLNEKQWRYMYHNAVQRFERERQEWGNGFNRSLPLHRLPKPPEGPIPTNEEMYPKQLPAIHFSNHELTARIVKQIETAEVWDWYQAWRWRRDQSAFSEGVEMDLITLEEARELVPINSHDDWREAIREASKAYAWKKTMETLPVVFDHYERCMQQGSPFEWKNEDNAHAFMALQYGTDSRNKVMQARAFLNEPENFDFMLKENLSQFFTP